MGFDEGRIILDRHDATYYNGQVIRGKLEFEQSTVKTFRGIYLEFKGFCKVHWTTYENRCLMSHDSYEEYVNQIAYLVGSKSGEHRLNPGYHVFPFEFQIPQHCPSSFEGSKGHVRYVIKATVDRAFKLDQHKHAFVRIVVGLNLNSNPYCMEGIGMEFYNPYCCWCLSSGESEITVKVPAGGAVPGQLLPVEVACKNDSNVKIDAIRFKLIKDILFHAEHEPATRIEHKKIVEVKKGPIPARTERNWVVELQIPNMNPDNMLGCRFIDIDYKFKVKIETSGCHIDDEESRPFIIGTIPLEAYNNQPIAAVENNPVSHGVSPYPPSPNPYPNVTPYPPNTSPYPPNTHSEAAPLLPAAAPYPASPYVSASAPEPSTPDVFGSK